PILYAALLAFYYRPSFSVLKAELLNLHLKWMFKSPTLMTMNCVVAYSTSNMGFNRKLRCSRTNTVRCAPRFLVSPHLLGPESRTFELIFKVDVQKSCFDDDAASRKLIRRRILNASENSAARVPTNVRCAPRSL